MTVEEALALIVAAVEPHEALLRAALALPVIEPLDHDRDMQIRGSLTVLDRDTP